jgi:predicted ATPase
MMAFFPLLLINKSERLSYSRARDNLLELVGIEIDQPIFSFTLKVSGDWAAILTKDKKITFEHFLKQANVCVLIDEVDSMDSEVTNEEAVQDFYAIFDWRVEILGLLLPYNQITPLQLFDEMMAWKRQGALKDLQLVINKVGNQGLLLNSSLSDGEYLLLGRMALLILLQEVNESLIILDEPETHLNDRWKRELISRIYNYLERQDQEKNSHQIIIATHSAITLTDADDSMVVVFKKNEGKVVVRGLASSVFGANLIHVTEEITEENFSVGQFANEWVHQYVDKYRDDKEKLKQLLEIVGPGVLRLYVIEAIRRIKKDVT